MSRILLGDQEVSYAGMTKIGAIEVREVRHGEIMIAVAGFEFEEEISCRTHSVRAMAWLRDVLDAQIKVEQLVNAAVYSAVG